jgi:hypothetical protein
LLAPADCEIDDQEVLPKSDSSSDTITQAPQSTPTLALDQCTFVAASQYQYAAQWPPTATLVTDILIGRMLVPSFLASALVGFLLQASTMATSPFDKFGFDMDTIGRTRQTSLIEEVARSTYDKAGIKVNIAVWNMHIPEDHHFNGILETGLQPMGRGGGFRIVVFRGEGYLRNRGGLGANNWRYSGNHWVMGNTVRSGVAAGTQPAKAAVTSKVTRTMTMTEYVCRTVGPDAELGGAKDKAEL